MDAFEREALEADALDEIATFALQKDAEGSAVIPCTIKKDAYLTLAMQGNRTGLITAEVEALEDTDLYITFDEILTDGEVNPYRMGCANVIIHRLAKGERYHLLTAEPYTFGYANVICRKGSLKLFSFGIRRVEFNRELVTRKLDEQKSDAVIARIYHAAVETFLQNTFDIYMDCPSRERAGWLCDSFFTSRVEHALTGKSTVERNFLSNFAMVERFDGLPHGMLPMCYPSEALRGEFIPNWAMWFVLELEEYLTRTNDRSLVDSLRQKLYDLLAYFRSFENDDGLLERLPGWIFVEWSRCNSLVWDVNYPTNMLYYRFKRAISALYGDPSLLDEAEALRCEIRTQSRQTLFFCDNAVRGENGELHLSGEVTETCQYYAFYMGVASVEEDPELWNTMLHEFGPDRKTNNQHPTVHFSNAFIGNYLRLELLSLAHEDALLDANIRSYFDYMAIRSDTLWENDSVVASCNHGFASHVIVWLDRLGYLN